MHRSRINEFGYLQINVPPLLRRLIKRDIKAISQFHAHIFYIKLWIPWPVVVNKRRSRISAAPITEKNILCAEALNRSFTVRPERRFQKKPGLTTFLKFLLFCFRKFVRISRNLLFAHIKFRVFFKIRKFYMRKLKIARNSNTRTVKTIFDGS